MRKKTNGNGHKQLDGTPEGLAPVVERFLRKMADMDAEAAVLFHPVLKGKKCFVLVVDPKMGDANAFEENIWDIDDGDGGPVGEARIALMAQSEWERLKAGRLRYPRHWPPLGEFVQVGQ